MNGYYVLGIILILIAIILNTIVNRRRFYRRGTGGLQHYGTYRAAVGHTCLDKLVKLIALSFLILGFVALVFGYNRQEKLQRKPLDNKEVHSKNGS